MNTAVLLFAAFSLAFILEFAVELYSGNRSTSQLEKIPPCADAGLPRVSVIIPARNEERHIREALQSVLRQDYSNLEFIAVNDRSTDNTATILAQMAREDARLRVFEIRDLPTGWIGKNYALCSGAQVATGDVLLFADADVVMHPSSVTRAVCYLHQRRLQHLAILPEIRMPGVFLGMFTSAFGLFFSLYARPWKAKDPKSKRFIGIGAFNLVDAAAYRAAGTHEAIAMRPDDDIKLGKLLKKHGARQELVFGSGMMHVEWYASVGQLVDGLMKNSFAGVGYSLIAGIGSGLALLLVFVWPFFAAFLADGATGVLNLLLAATILFIAADSNSFHGIPRWYALGIPLGALLFAYIVWRSMVITLWTGGIRWRGTFYPLANLRANKV